MKKRMKHLLGSLLISCGLLSISSPVWAQHATNYSLGGLNGVIEQQAAPTMVSIGNVVYNVQTIVDAEDADILITKTKKGSGGLIWSFRYGVNNIDEVGFSMVEGLDGSLIIVGHRQAPGQPQENLLLCIDDAGNVVWDRVFGNPNWNQSSRLIIDAKGVGGTNAFVVAGIARDNAINNWTPAAYAIDAAGNLLWHARYDEIVSPMEFQYYLPTSMLITEQYEVVIAGHAHNSGEPSSLFTLGINTVDGGLLPTGLRSYDVMGTLSEEQFPSIIRAENAQGYTMSFNSIFGGGIERIGLLRLNDNRDEVWTQIHWLNGVEVQRPINLELISGTYEMSLFLKNLVSDGEGVPALLRVFNNGAYLSGVRYGGYQVIGIQHTMNTLGGEHLGKTTPKPNLQVFGLYETDNLSIVNDCSQNIPNSFFAQFDSETNQIPMVNDLDYDITQWIPALPEVGQVLAFEVVCPQLASAPAPVGQQEIQQSYMKFYPNPSNGNFTMSIAETVTEGTVQILDPLGRVVYGGDAQSGDVQVDLSQEAKGLYTIVLQDGEKVHTHKLLVE